MLDCVRRYVENANRQHEKEMQQKMLNLGADPKAQEFIKKYADASKKMSDATQKKDSVALKKALRDLNALIGINSQKDTTAAYEKCGKPPAKPATLVRTEKLNDEMQALNEELRKVEGDVTTRAAAAAGMPAQKYAQARERLWAWNVQSKQKRKADNMSVTKGEDGLFRSRASDITPFEKLLK